MRRFRFVVLTVLTVSAVTGGIVACKSNTISSSTAEGRTVEGPDGVRLLVPAGAVPPEVELAIAEAPAGSYPMTKAPNFKSKVYAITPHGTKFSTDVRIEFNAPPGAADQEYAIWKAEEGGSWETITKSYPIQGGRLSADISNLSYFAVAAQPCWDIMSTPVPGQPPCPLPSNDGGMEGGPIFNPDGGGPFPDGGGMGGMCQGSGRTVDTTLTAGAASLPGSWTPTGGSAINLSQLTHSCGLIRQGGAGITLFFAASAEYCQGLKGGLVNKSIPALMVVLDGWNGGDQDFQFAGAGAPSYQNIDQNSPLCFPSSLNTTQGTGTGGDAGTSAATVDYTIATSKADGTLSFTTNGGAQTVNGIFTNTPLFNERTGDPAMNAYCCE